MPAEQMPRVDFFGQSLSISQTQALLDALKSHVAALLNPAQGWFWLDEPFQADAAPCPVAWLHSPEQILGSDDGLITEENMQLFRDMAKGRIVQLKPDLFQCWFYEWVEADHKATECGLASDLYDAKWLIAEKWRVLLAGAKG